MFPFGDNPLEPSSFKKPNSFQLYDQIQNPIISKHDDSTSTFFPNFPSPFFDEHELPLNQIFFPNFHSKPAIPDHTQKISEYPTKKESRCSKLKQKPPHHPISAAAAPRRRGLLGAATAAPRKRTGKKDRHSKICTAQGIRDRRMRLSLQVARKFFDLQDMLGYDKASKTIEWLFNKSKKAIKELTKDINVRGNNVSVSDAKSESFASECEVVSGIEENCSNNEIKEGFLAAAEEEEDGNGGLLKGDKKSRKLIACKPNTRESREKARARARCRTEEKMMGKRVGDPAEWCKSSPNCNDLEKLGSSSSQFDGGDHDRRDRDSAYGGGGRVADYSPLVHPPPSDVGTIEKLLGSSSSDYNSSAAVSCCVDPSSSFMGFLGNWDLLSNDRLNYAGNPNSIYSATTPDFPLFHQ